MLLVGTETILATLNFIGQYENHKNIMLTDSWNSAQHIKELQIEVTNVIYYMNRNA